MEGLFKSLSFKSNQSEEDVTIDSFTKFPFFWFRFLMFDFKPVSFNATLREKITRSARKAYVKFTILILTMGLLSLTGFSVAHSDDFVMAARSVPTFVIMGLVIQKTLTIFSQRTEIWDLIQEVKEVFEIREKDNKNFKVKQYLDNYLFNIKSYAAIFFIITFPIAYPVVPFLLNGTMELAVTYWFPFDIYRWEVFPFGLFWADFCGINAILHLLACDSIVYSLIAILSMEFDAIKEELINLRYVNKKKRAKILPNLVNRHNKLLQLSDKMQNICASIFFFSVFITSLIMCFVVFQLSIAFSTTYSLFVPFLCIVLGQIFLLCVFGQKLIDSSGSLTDGIQMCGWEDFDDNSLKKDLRYSDPFKFKKT